MRADQSPPPCKAPGTPLKTVFLGTGDIAIPSFTLLLERDDVDLVALVTQEDKPAGRGKKLKAPPIKALAVEAGIPVFQPRRAMDAIAELAAFDADLFVVMAYGQILPRTLLDLPRCACWNLHASLLPRHRGASPIQAAILAGDNESGVTVMHVAEALDAGDMVIAESLVLHDQETGGSLHDRLAGLAPVALARALDHLRAGTAPRTPQDPDKVTVLGKLARGDGLLDWSRPAADLARMIRAYHPWPGTHSALPDGSFVKIHPPVETLPETHGTAGEILEAGPGQLVIACGQDALALNMIQPAGKRRMPVADFLRGHAVAAGTCLG